MKTIAETRLDRLNMLVKEYGSLAALNCAIGLDRTDSTLSQIRTKSPTTQTRKPRSMGDALARKIEVALQLPVGWMDTPPTPVELYGEEDARVRVLQLLESMPPDLWQMAVRLLDAMARPTQTNSIKAT